MKIDKVALAKAIGIMMLSWAALPIVYWLLMRKEKKEEVKKEENDDEYADGMV